MHVNVRIPTGGNKTEHSVIATSKLDRHTSERQLVSERLKYDKMMTQQGLTCDAMSSLVMSECAVVLVRGLLNIANKTRLSQPKNVAVVTFQSPGATRRTVAQAR